jgi:hypothetical protein
LVKYYAKQLQFKIRKIKIQLAAKMQTVGTTLKHQETLSNFQTVRESIGTTANRIRGIYSYNVLDNPEFIHSKKVEQQIMKM